LNVTIRLYFDEDSMRRSLVRVLRARGIDVITGKAGKAPLVHQGDERPNPYVRATLNRAFPYEKPQVERQKPWMFTLGFFTALDAEMIGRKDTEHLDYATEQGRVLCTFNVGDFCRLHSDYVAQGRRHAGIVLMQQQRFSVGEQMRRLLRLIASKSADEMENWIEFLSAWS
jgi:hypothetical protein